VSNVTEIIFRERGPSHL